jgi:hypothetical protein
MEKIWRMIAALLSLLVLPGVCYLTLPRQSGETIGGLTKINREGE